MVDWPHLNWLRKLPVPQAYSSMANLPNTVWDDMKQFARLSVQAAAETGARSVGMIAPVYPPAQQRDGSPHPNGEFILEFVQAAHAAGLETRNEWMCVSASPDEGNRNQEIWGYRKLHEFWRQPTRPEALVVYPDTTARGVVMGLLELQVRVPQDLKLVLHKNVEVEMLCPLPATFLTVSMREVAQALLEQVEQQFYGNSCAPKLIGYRREPLP